MGVGHSLLHVLGEIRPVDDLLARDVERGHEVELLRGDSLQRLVVDQRAMRDDVAAGLDRVVQPRLRVRVHRDAFAPPVRFVREHGELFERVVLPSDVLVLPHEAA